ncbi:Set1/Ash2 histone methyltransferase complex subunit ASH2 [Portunus trituberculatus]|uniref:Set1/Ash2 histone methyltransferase complex subunit ASH2 n=1 Tax=Portunus trituberculatus TaxID=210409 RepID=A0A5B7IRL0_PORTR|nr:Set1/Ash2 histone methyltransferase complex subunit ASH2 [Portunus trituberculatus]
MVQINLGRVSQGPNNCLLTHASTVGGQWTRVCMCDCTSEHFSGKLRNLNSVELMCWQCGSWFHESCISYQLGKLVPFMLNYSFTCKNCSPTSIEIFRKTQARKKILPSTVFCNDEKMEIYEPSNKLIHHYHSSISPFTATFHPHLTFTPELRDMCITALANLQHSCQKDSRGGAGTMFSLQRDVIPFLEQNWEALTTAARRSTQSWHTTLQRILMKEVDAYFNVEETGESGEPTQYHPYFGLITSDLTLIRPLVDAPGGWRSPLAGSCTYPPIHHPPHTP